MQTTLEQPRSDNAAPTVGATADQRRRDWKRLLLALALMFTCGGFGLWWGVYKTYHLKTVQPGVLYRDGNQGLREFRNAMRQARPRTVVSLIDDQELADAKKRQFADEAAYLARQKVDLVRIPVKLGGWPTKSDVARFLDVVNDPARQPVLVHCAQGVRRTGFMVAAYQQSVLGYDDQRAEDAIETYGHSERTVRDVREFVRGYDPKTGAVPEGMTVGDE